MPTTEQADLRVFSYLRQRPRLSAPTVTALIAGTGVVFLWLYTMYSTLFGQAETYSHASTFYLTSLFLVFLMRPLGRSSWRAPLNAWFIVDLVCMVLVLSLVVFIRWDIDDLLMRGGGGFSTSTDHAMSAILIFLTLEATRRTIGSALAIVAGVFFFYGIMSHLFPGPLKVASVPTERMLDLMLFDTSGIFGLPVAVVSTYVIIFLIFGAVLFNCGIGALMSDLSLALTGRLRGGPAKASVVASTMFGMVTGSAAANVSVSGTFTIPLMKRVGYRPEVAGAIEAVASVGSLVTPPVMGAGAFVIAAFMGVSYWQVATMAVIPAVLFYLFVLASVHFEAIRFNIPAWDGDLPKVGPVMRARGHLLLPLAALLVALMMGISPAQAAFWATVAGFAVSFLRKETRLGPWRLLSAMESAIMSGLGIFVACGAAGMIIGSVNISGLGLRFSELIMLLSGGYLWAGALLAALVGLVLGLGLTPTVVYITMYALVVPALIALGAPEPAAHMMGFYFGMLGNLTPPVAIAAFTGAAIAGANPLKTALQATRIGLAAYLLPMVFIYTPEVLMIGETFDILYKTAFVALGILAFAAGASGAIFSSIGPIERLVLMVAGASLTVPGVMSGLAGAAVLIIVLVLNWFSTHRSRQEPLMNAKPRGGQS